MAVAQSVKVAGEAAFVPLDRVVVRLNWGHVFPVGAPVFSGAQAGTHRDPVRLDVAGHNQFR